MAMSPQAAPTNGPMLLGLDVGEMDVLLLAREQRQDWVLIDERLGRRVARAMGLPANGIGRSPGGIPFQGRSAGCPATTGE